MISDDQTTSSPASPAVALAKQGALHFAVWLLAFSLFAATDSWAADEARQGKARQGKARQGKARQGKARQGKTRLGKYEKTIRKNMGKKK